MAQTSEQTQARIDKYGARLAQIKGKLDALRAKHERTDLTEEQRDEIEKKIRALIDKGDRVAAGIATLRAELKAAEDIK